MTDNRYSIFSLARNAFSNHRNWPRAWRSPELKPAYDVIIVGGGGHGLATAYYLAKEHGVANVAVVEKGWNGKVGGSSLVLGARGDVRKGRQRSSFRGLKVGMGSVGG